MVTAPEYTVSPRQAPAPFIVKPPPLIVSEPPAPRLIMFRSVFSVNDVPIVITFAVVVPASVARTALSCASVVTTDKGLRVTAVPVPESFATLSVALGEVTFSLTVAPPLVTDRTLLVIDAVAPAANDSPARSMALAVPNPVMRFVGPASVSIRSVAAPANAMLPVPAAVGTASSSVPFLIVVPPV